MYFEAGRVEWLRRRGVTYADWAHRGVHLPWSRRSVRYRAPSRFDDLLTVETTLTELRRLARLHATASAAAETLIAEGSTRLACIDAHHKLLRIPEDMRDVAARAAEQPSGAAALDARRIERRVDEHAAAGERGRARTNERRS